MRSSRKNPSCRLCGSETEYAFRKRVLARHDVRYYRCSGCASTQTEAPYWLDEAYAIPGLHIDVGAPTRSMKNWLAAVTLLDLLGVKADYTGVDFGAGPGLFASLMRSSGFDFHAQDKYAAPLYANYFSVKDAVAATPDVLTAFEVFEHLPTPRKTLDELFGAGAPLVLFTTWMNDDQPDDWVYYLPECGQHVFFYSERGMRETAARHGYRMQVSQYFYILSNPAGLTRAQLAVIDGFALNAVSLVAGRIADIAGHVIMGNPHIDRDFALAGKRFDGYLAKTKRRRAAEFPHAPSGASARRVTKT